jgi:hypothetical protein
MAKYLDIATIQDLIVARDLIFSERNTQYANHDVDVLDNDVLSSLSIWEIVSQYEPDYSVNFSRTGEDATCNGTIIEQKCSLVKKPTEKPTFKFHAKGTIDYPRYIFAVRQKDNLKMLRIYDISNAVNVKMVSDYLHTKSQTWTERGRLDESKMKNDMILMPEKVLLEKLVKTTMFTVTDCQVIRA